MTDSIDDNKCPICGRLNSCRYSKQGNSEQKSCWCKITEFAFPINLMARIPKKFKDKACICEHCAQEYQNDHPT